MFCKDNRVKVCHKVKPFTIREQKMLRVAPPMSKVQQRVNTKMKTNLRLWLSKLLMNFYKLTIGGCPFSKEHRWRFFSTVTYCQKSEVFMIVIMIGTTFLFCDMGCLIIFLWHQKTDIYLVVRGVFNKI